MGLGRPLANPPLQTSRPPGPESWVCAGVRRGPVSSLYRVGGDGRGPCGSSNLVLRGPTTSCPQNSNMVWLLPQLVVSKLANGVLALTLACNLLMSRIIYTLLNGDDLQLGFCKIAAKSRTSIGSGWVASRLRRLSWMDH